jgi:PKD repeat protein
VVCSLRDLARASFWLLLPTAFVLVAITSGRAPEPARAAAPAVKASFSFTPSSPFTNEDVTFNSTSVVNRTIISELWDLDNDGQFDDASGNTASRRFYSPITYTVRLQVTIVGGIVGTASRTVPVQDRPPVASFDYEPAFPQSGQAVSFKSTSSDPDDGIKSQSWDLDNDGRFDDANGTSATWSFKTAGSHTVTLQVVDNHKKVSVVSRAVSVGNRPPTVSFAYVPGSPLPGQVVTFYSTASDPDGPLAQQVWDFDNDGQFDDASGPSATWSFNTLGNYTVGLRVADEEGLSATGFETVVVRSPSTTVTTLGLRLLTPFPIVRIAGTVTDRGAKLKRLSINAPSGASILIRCRGRSCPRSRFSRKASVRIASLVRIRALERHFLRTGTRLEIYIRKPGLIGKYTRFRIRSGKAPARLDRCLLPGGRRPIRCPLS